MPSHRYISSQSVAVLTHSVPLLIFQLNSNMNTSASSQPTTRTRVSSAPTSTNGSQSDVTAETIRLDRRITDLTDRVDLIDGQKRAENYTEETDEEVRTNWLDEQEKRLDGLDNRMGRSERETMKRLDRVERFMRGVAKFLDSTSGCGSVMNEVHSGMGHSGAWAEAMGEANEVPDMTETNEANGAIGTIGMTSGGGSGAASNAGLDWVSGRTIEESYDLFDWSKWGRDE